MGDLRRVGFFCGEPRDVPSRHGQSAVAQMLLARRHPVGAPGSREAGESDLLRTQTSWPHGLAA